MAIDCQSGTRATGLLRLRQMPSPVGNGDEYDDDDDDDDDDCYYYHCYYYH